MTLPFLAQPVPAAPAVATFVTILHELTAGPAPWVSPLCQSPVSVPCVNPLCPSPMSIPFTSLLRQMPQPVPFVKVYRPPTTWSPCRGRRELCRTAHFPGLENAGKRIRCSGIHGETEPIFGETRGNGTDTPGSAGKRIRSSVERRETSPVAWLAPSDGQRHSSFPD